DLDALLRPEILFHGGGDPWRDRVDRERPARQPPPQRSEQQEAYDEHGPGKDRDTTRNASAKRRTAEPEFPAGSRWDEIVPRVGGHARSVGVGRMHEMSAQALLELAQLGQSGIAVQPRHPRIGVPRPLAARTDGPPRARLNLAAVLDRDC